MDPLASGALGLLVIGGFGYLARWAWTHTHERIDETRKMLLEHEHEDRKRHDEMLRVTTRIDTQMGRFISDIESEKRTRAQVNRDIFEKLDRISERLPERRDNQRDER